jgi:hypothetical protein
MCHYFSFLLPQSFKFYKQKQKFIFYGLKIISPRNDFITNLRNKVVLKSRVLNYAENIERGPKILVFSDFPGNVQKSDFPTKRSHFRK